MDKKQLIEYIKEYTGLVQFQPVSEGAGTVSLIRETEFAKDIISITYVKSYTGFTFAPGISGFRSIKTVESILTKYFRKYKFNCSDITIYRQSRRDKYFGSVKVSSKEDVSKIIPRLKEMINKDILPFFNEYDTLMKIYCQLEEFDNDMIKINKFLFNPQPIRRIIINKLCNRLTWRAEAQKVQEAFLEASKSGMYKTIYKSYAQIVTELIEELDPMS